MQHLYTALDALIEKHKDNEYIMGRLEVYMTQLIPNALQAETQTHKKREQRKQILNEGRQKFTERFMCKNNYYYCPNNELFLNYNGTHFIGQNEDNIHHQILSKITNEQGLVPWKHKINNEIIRLIKTRSPLRAMPESLTIQFVLNTIIRKLFPSRYSAKYFLTFLGDNILGKTEQSLICIISPLAKEIIQEMGHVCSTHFGIPNIVLNIKYKYYGHDYANCRLLRINTNYQHTPDDLSREISKYMIDLLCVATHYSMRYNSADNYLLQCSDTDFVEKTLYLSKNTPESIVDSFISSSIETCEGSNMETKNMIFIWKKYLGEKELPNILFYEPLKALLKAKLEYDQETDMFTNITSTSIPLVGNFLQFWETTITEDPVEHEFEIDELSYLFKRWSKKNSVHVTEDLLLDLIRHFYPQIEIVEDKYLLHLKCSLWDKRQDVINSLDYFKLLQEPNSEQEIPSLSVAYQRYISLPQSYYVSKYYYEKIAKEELEGKIDLDGVLTL